MQSLLALDGILYKTGLGGDIQGLWREASIEKRATDEDSMVPFEDLDGVVLVLLSLG